MSPRYDSDLGYGIRIKRREAAEGRPAGFVVEVHFYDRSKAVEYATKLIFDAMQQNQEGCMNSKAIISGAGKYDGEYFIDTSMTLGFLPLTEAEKQKLVERVAQDLAYEAGASARTLAKAAARKARRTRLRLKA